MIMMISTNQFHKTRNKRKQKKREVNSNQKNKILLDKFKLSGKPMKRETKTKSKN